MVQTHLCFQYSRKCHQTYQKALHIASGQWPKTPCQFSQGVYQGKEMERFRLPKSISRFKSINFTSWREDRNSIKQASVGIGCIGKRHFKGWDQESGDIWVASLSLRRHAHGTLAKRLMHMAHFSGNTSGMSKSSSDWLNSTGFPGDMSVAFIFGPPGNKDAVFTNVTTKAYQGQLNAGFSKVCEIFKVHGIESLKYIREFTHRFVFVATFPHPETWR